MTEFKPVGLGLASGATRSLRDGLREDRHTASLPGTVDTEPSLESTTVDENPFEANFQSDANAIPIPHKVALIGPNDTLLFRDADTAPGCMVAEIEPSGKYILQLHHNVFALVVAIAPVTDGQPDPDSLSGVFDKTEVETLKIGTGAANRLTFLSRLSSREFPLPDNVAPIDEQISLAASLAILDSLGKKSYVLSRSDPADPDEPDTVVGAAVPGKSHVMAITLEDGEISVDRLNGLGADPENGANFSEADLVSVIGWVAIAPDGTLAISGVNTAGDIASPDSAPRLAVRTTAKTSWSKFHPASKLQFPWQTEHPPDLEASQASSEAAHSPPEETAADEDDPSGGLCVFPGTANGPIRRGIF